MKKFLPILIFLWSFTVFSQGPIFEVDRNQVLEGPGFFKLGINTRNELIEIKSESPFFASPVTGKNLKEKMLVNKLPDGIENKNRQEIACVGQTEVINGILQLVETDVCVKIVSGELLYKKEGLSQEEVQKARFDIDEVLWERLGADDLSQRINDSRRARVPEREDQGLQVREVPPSYHHQR